MTKSELLNILYAERSRLEKTYSRPGWTLWAIGGATASLAWLLWEWAEKCKDWSYAVLVFFLVYFVVTIVGAFATSFKTFLNIPVWRKGFLKDRVLAVLNTILCIGIIVSQLYIIPATFHRGLYWKSFGCIILIILLTCSVFIMSYVGYVTSGKNMKWSALLATIFFPTVILFATYLYGLEYNPVAARVGVLSYVIIYLLNLIPIGEKKIFIQIDRLISRVLYEVKEVNETNVLKEMELYTIGLRFGKYLSKTKLHAVMRASADLTECSQKLIDEFASGDKSRIDIIIKEGQDKYDTLKKLSLSFLSQISVNYDEKNVDSSLSPILKAGRIGVEAMRLWQRVCDIRKKELANWREQLEVAVKETMGQPEILKLMKDPEIWNAMQNEPT